MALRIASFNAENLLHRFDFSGWKHEVRRDRTLQMLRVADEAQYRSLEQARVIAHTDDKMQLTALAIADTEADIVCLQEIEAEEALEAFEQGYLFRMADAGYRFRHLSRGNDTRGIDVALLARPQTAGGEPIEIVEVRSHAAMTYAEAGVHDARLAGLGESPDDRVFRRDCLEVDLTVGGRALTIYVIHLKSMGGARDGRPGRDHTMPVRTAEAGAVRALVTARFGDRVGEASWLICGDFNDYRERLVVEGGLRGPHAFRHVEEGDCGFDPLLADDFSVDLMRRRPATDRWTLFHSRGRDEQHLCQLDYILASPRLAERNPEAVPDIIRNGQPWRVPFPAGQEVARYPRIGWDRPKSSDHCPVAVTLSVP